MLPVLGCLLASFVGGVVCQKVALLPLQVQSTATRECKACPYIGCVNKAYPGFPDGDVYNVTGTCWTSGQAINNLTLWVKTTDSCYINEWDLVVEEAQDLRANLTNCGRVAPVITEVKAKTKYVTECQTHPTMDWSEGVYSAKFYQKNVDLTLTCKTTNPDAPEDTVAIFGDRTWFRTKYSYCFVHQKLLYDVAGANKLPDCGPINPRLNTGDRSPDPEARRKAQKPKPWYKTPKKTSKPKKATPRPPAQKRKTLSRRGLFRNIVNEDGVVCRAEPGNNSSAIIKRYPYGREITAQCGLYLDFDLNDIGIFTIDNCWVLDSQLEIMIEDETNNINEYLKYCDYYVDTPEWLPTDTWGCGVTVDC